MTKGMIVMGRLVLWLIHDWFRLNPDMKPLFGLQAITDLQWYGDAKIFGFMDMWDKIVNNNTITLNHKQLAALLMEKMEQGQTKALGQDVAYWRRLPEGNEQKSYEYLLNAMQSYLDRTQMERNNQLQRATMQNGGPTAVHALDGSKYRDLICKRKRKRERRGQGQGSEEAV